MTMSHDRVRAMPEGVEFISISLLGKARGVVAFVIRSEGVVVVEVGVRRNIAGFHCYVFLLFNWIQFEFFLIISNSVCFQFFFNHFYYTHV